MGDEDPAQGLSTRRELGNLKELRPAWHRGFCPFCSGTGPRGNHQGHGGSVEGFYYAFGNTDFTSSAIFPTAPAVSLNIANADAL